MSHAALEAGMRDVYGRDFLRANFGLEEGKCEVVGKGRDIRLLVRDGRKYAIRNLWCVSDLALQVNLLDRWVKEAAEDIQGLA